MEYAGVYITDMQDIFGFLEDIFKYIVSPAVIFYILGKVYGLGELHHQFKSALRDISDLKSEMSAIHKSIDRVNTSVTVVKTYLVTDMGVNSNLFDASSPLSLQPEGQELLEESGFPTIFSENRTMFVSRVREFPLENPADLDEAAFRVLDSLSSDPLLKDFKVLAYEHGIAVEVVLKICAIYMRDALMSEFFPDYRSNS